MANATEKFEKVIENQQQLVEKLTTHAQKAAELYTVEKEDVEAGQALVTAYMNESKALFEAAVKPENTEKFYESLPEHFNKTVAMQQSFFNQTLDYYRGLFEKYGMEYQQENFKQLSEIYKGNYQAVVETANANAKLMQNLFA